MKIQNLTRTGLRILGLLTRVMKLERQALDYRREIVRMAGIMDSQALLIIVQEERIAMLKHDLQRGPKREFLDCLEEFKAMDDGAAA